MEKKLYSGEITLQVFTTVEANEEPVQERNNAHLDLDFDLFSELRKLVEGRGYHAPYVGADLHHVEDVDKSVIEFVSKKKAESKNRRQKRYMRI